LVVGAVLRVGFALGHAQPRDARKAHPAHLERGTTRISIELN
jgi:hypothetical protein